MKWKHFSIWQALLVLAALLLVLDAIIGEWLHSPSAYAFDPRYGPIFKPHARILQGVEGLGAREANSLGLLGDEPRVPRAPLRVLLMGDSFAEALQVSNQESFSSVAERSLPGTEILNVARSASFPAHYAAEIATFDSLLAPDLIVVEVNDGDVREILNPALMEHARQFGEAREAFRPGGPGRWLASHFALVSFMKVRLGMLADKERTRLSSKLGLGRGGYVESMSGPVDPHAAVILDSLYQIMRHVGRPILFLYIPDLDYFATPPVHRYPTRRELFLSFAARNGVPIVDPTEAMFAEYRRTRQPLQGFQNSLFGGGHLNARGHAVVGELLARAIAEVKR